MDALRLKMCEIGQRAYARGLVSATEGNFSARLDDHGLLCTPTNFCKGLLTPDDLCEVNLDGQRLAGARAPSSEIRMHFAVYRAAPAVNAVIHAHPPFATTWALLGEPLPSGMLPEGDMFLGDVPLVPYATTGTAEMAAAIEPFVDGHVACLLQNHGAVTWGDDLEQAYTRMETLETLCRVVYQARAIGTPQPIPDDKRPALAEIRRQLRAQPPT